MLPTSDHKVPGLIQPDPEDIKLFSCSTQLSMKFSHLINMKMPTIVGIFIFVSREIFMRIFPRLPLFFVHIPPKKA